MFLSFIYLNGKKISILIIILTVLMISNNLYTSYIIELKETIKNLERENIKLFADLRKCITEYEYEELNRSIQTIEEEKKDDR